jgi:hypothetical protein
MKYIILMILMAVYVLMTMSIQEGMVNETNIQVITLRSTEEWDEVKTKLQTFLGDTSAARYVLMYPSGGNINDCIDYLEGIGENPETDTKMLLYIWAPLDDAVGSELVDILGIDSVPTPFTKGLFTFEAESEAVTETNYNVSIISTVPSGKKVKQGMGKTIEKGGKKAMEKTDEGARKFFGMKEKKKKKK